MSTGELSQEEIDALLNRAADRARKASEVRRGGPAEPEKEAAGAEPEAFGDLLDLPLDVRIRLGEAEMTIEEVVSLRDGSVIDLDRSPGDPVDILVNDRVVARGDIVVVDDRFTVRVTEVVTGPAPEAGEAKRS